MILTIVIPNIMKDMATSIVRFFQQGLFIGNYISKLITSLGLEPVHQIVLEGKIDSKGVTLPWQKKLDSVSYTIILGLISLTT